MIIANHWHVSVGFLANATNIMVSGHIVKLRVVVLGMTKPATSSTQIQEEKITRVFSSWKRAKNVVDMKTVSQVYTHVLPQHAYSKRVKRLAHVH